jgi:3-oxoacyl-[acyl-carrier-protein] synthase-3
MLLEGGVHARPSPAVRYRARFESLGLALPEKRLTSVALLAESRHQPKIDLERLTGIRERRVCSDAEDSFTLAVSAAKDCLAHASHTASSIEMLVSCSISKNRGGLRHHFEPPLSAEIARAIGADRSRSFDVSNACAGMLTGVFILNDYIRRGAIRCGMLVSGESISNLGQNAARDVRSILSQQLASLTLGDAGVAAILERAPEGNPGIELAAFTTLSEHSRLCFGRPAKKGPGGAMFTKARRIHQVAIEDAPPLLGEALEESGLDFGEIDWVIPHQTSARAILKGTQEISRRLGVAPRNVVVNLAERGNTASTTHFVALREYLDARRFKRGDRILLLSFASGLEVGVVVFTMDELLERYGVAD